MPGLPTLSSPPPPPSRSDDSANFVAKADAFVGWFPTHVAEMNAALTAIPEIAAAVNYNTTSSSSLAIATGLINFTTPIGGILQIGQFIIAASLADPSNYMAGQIVSNDPLTGILSVNITASGGSGTHSDWLIAITVPDELAPVAAIAISGSGADLVTASTPLTKLVVASGNSKLLGAGASGSGAAYVEITLGTNITMTGTTLNVSSGTATVSNGDYGDITVSSSGTVWTIDNGVVTYAKMQTFGAHTFICNPTASAAAPIEQTITAAGLAILDDADAAAQRVTLGLGTIATFAEGTTAQYWANTAGKALSTDKVWAAAAFVSLTQASTIAVDMSTGFNFTTTMTGNRTLGNPSNPKVGQSGVIELIQDSAGHRTLSFAANWKFAGGSSPTLSTVANKKDYLSYIVISSTFIWASLVLDVS